MGGKAGGGGRAEASTIADLGAVDLGAELGAQIHGAEVRHVGCRVSVELYLVWRSRRHMAPRC